MVTSLMKKYLFIGVLLLFVALFIYWSLGQMQNLPIKFVGKGEKGRFMRYLSCAVAMCSATHQTDGDGCHSGEVINQGLEYDGQSLKKGCKELCEELRNAVGVTDDRYCGSQYAFTFEFQENVNFDSLDIRNAASFYNRVIPKGCYICTPKIPSITFIPSEGYLLRYTADSCGERPISHDDYPGVIWLSSAIESKCSDPHTADGVTSYSYCEFNAGDTVTISAGPENPHYVKYWEWKELEWAPTIGTSCGTRAAICAITGGCIYYCPQIFVC